MAGRLQKIPEDVYREATEMLADGLTVRNVANYLGLSESGLRYHLFPERKATQQLKNKLSYQKYRIQRLAKMAEWQFLNK